MEDARDSCDTLGEEILSNVAISRFLSLGPVQSHRMSFLVQAVQTGRLYDHIVSDKTNSTRRRHQEA
jgi:hypothetical protein